MDLEWCINYAAGWSLVYSDKLPGCGLSHLICVQKYIYTYICRMSRRVLSHEFARYQLDACVVCTDVNPA